MVYKNAVYTIYIYIYIYIYADVIGSLIFLNERKVPGKVLYQ